jgi:hypothetical protein
MRQVMDDKLEYVRLRGTVNGAIYRICDDKIVDGVKKLVLLTVDGSGIGGYIEVSPDEIEPLERRYR